LAALDSAKKGVYMETIIVVLATDDGYSQHAGVMLCSLFENNLSRNPFEVYLMDGGISDENKRRLHNVAERYNARLELLEIDREIYKDFKLSHHITQAAYYRISIPDILDSSVRKAIYLDCDLIVRDDIAKLWRLDLSGFLLGAIEDPGFSRFQALGIPNNARYFNSGVMLIDLAKWRSAKISSQVLDFIVQNPEKVVLWDQDALNAVLYDKWLPMHLKWNVQTDMYELSHRERYVHYEDFDEAIRSPSIVHYTASPKPWQYMNKHPLKKEYYKHLRKTEWRNFTPPDRNMINMVKKVLKSILRKK